MKYRIVYACSLVLIFTPVLQTEWSRAQQPQAAEIVLDDGSRVKRVHIEDDPYFDDSAKRVLPWLRHGIWPCKWVQCSEAVQPPFVSAYRRIFTLERDLTVRVHVSADERYELYLDGKRIGRGSERGYPQSWFYETYDFTFRAGQHVLVARVWSMGPVAPRAQMSVYPGFIFSPEGEENIERLGTGVAPWEAMIVPGYQFAGEFDFGFKRIGPSVSIDGELYPWEFEKGAGNGWRPVVAKEPGADARSRNNFYACHLLSPGTLPPMMERAVKGCRIVHISEVDTTFTKEIPVRSLDHRPQEMDKWQALLEGRGQVTLAPGTARRVIVDLGTYYCVYPELVTNRGRGARVCVRLDESLRLEPRTLHGIKGNRDEIENKYFAGGGDTYIPDGGTGRLFQPLWWLGGRYMEIVAQTDGEPLVIERLTLLETRYPMEIESSFECDEPRFEYVERISMRCVQIDAHEIFFDWPYEQMMFIGDTRVQALIHFTIHRDDRLIRKAIRTLQASQRPDGVTQSRYPNRNTQIIPGYSLAWIGMLYDYAMWRGDRDFIKSRMPAARSVIDFHLRYLNEEGLVEAVEWWNYIDVTQGDKWENSIPPDAETGVSSVINWQFAVALDQAARLESWLDEPELAARDRRIAEIIAARLGEKFWDEDRGLYADNIKRTSFSEHAQILALLSGQLDHERQIRVSENLVKDPDLVRTSFYFMHYLFEAYALTGQIDAFFNVMDSWYRRHHDYGLRTTLEHRWIPSRSDTHAWAAHPLYHFFTTILGVRPASFGFEKVHIRPQPGPLTKAKGTMVHPKGEIKVSLELIEEKYRGETSLPEGVSGILQINGERLTLAPGSTRF